MTCESYIQNWSKPASSAARMISSDREAGAFPCAAPNFMRHGLLAVDGSQIAQTRRLSGLQSPGTSGGRPSACDELRDRGPVCALEGEHLPRLVRSRDLERELAQDARDLGDLV